MPLPLTLLASLAFMGLQKFHQGRIAASAQGGSGAHELVGPEAGAVFQLLEHVVGHIAGSSAHEDLNEVRRLVADAFQGPTPDKNLDLERSVARAALHADLFCLMETLHEPTDKAFL